MKTEVYSYRLTPSRKTELKKAARHRKVKIAQVLDMAVDEWLAKNGGDIADDEEQQRLHAIAARWIGSIHSGRRDGSAKVREVVRARLAEKYGR
jgi:hypothetical protein